MKETGLYSSRLIKNYVEYLKEYHPQVNIVALLNYAGITSYQVEDGGHWFSQKQVDLFHEGIQQQTNANDIPKNVGRNAPFSRAAGMVSQYALGLITPSVAYSVLGKLYHFFSRACTIQIKNLKSNKVEIIITTNPGVEEKPFQCENRMGTFEAIAKLFTTKFADIEHPKCIHRGDDNCCYLISWENTPSLIWKNIRNYIALSAFVTCPIFFYLLHDKPWIWTIPILFYLLFVLIFFLYAEYLEKRELVTTLKSQGKLADTLLDEINTRYNNAMLIQEIGQATSMILDSEHLIKLVMEAMEKRLDFDRGMIMLANQEKTRLIYSAGYGYNPEHENYLMGIAFHLDKSTSKGPLVESFRLQNPILINNINEIENDLSKKSQEFAKMMGAQSFICVPIIFGKKSMGILMVDNVRSKRSLMQSDVSLLMGIATQVAISINNAVSYQKVLESEERFRSLSENAPDIIYRLDTNGLFTYVNPAWERILGHSLEEIMGRYFIDFVKKEDIKDYIRLFKQITDEKRIVRDQIGTILHKDGADRVFYISGAPNLDLKGNVTGVVGIFKDISEQQKLESQLLHAQKMEAIGTLAGGIAHDFNNLLTGIQGHVSLMFLEINVSHPFYEKLKGIEDQVRSGAELTKQLLGFARGGKYEIAVVDLNEIVNKTSTMFGRTRKEISIHRKNERNLWSVEVDRGQIEQVLLNMYVNSWQAMPGGGDLYLETFNIILDEDYVKPFTVKPGRYVTVSITDTGIGMDEKTIERIFDPFFTTKEMGRGTGLGLASAYGIIQSHNGFINVKSEKGNGTTFTVYIPASDKKAMHVEKVTDNLVKGDGNILLVDDEDVIIDVGKEILEVLGYKVFTAKSGHEAIRVLSERRDEIDLVILDMIMPGMSGGETFDAIKLMNSNIKVVLSSGYSLDARQTKKLDRNYDGFIQKPYDITTLSQKVKSVLDTKPQ